MAKIYFLKQKIVFIVLSLLPVYVQAIKIKEDLWIIYFKEVLPCETSKALRILNAFTILRFHGWNIYKMIGS